MTWVRARPSCEHCSRAPPLAGRTLERRWDEALQAVRKVEEDFDRFLCAQPRLWGEADRERVRRQIVAWARCVVLAD